MSRRDFLKVTGKAAAGAAAPKSLLKGLIPTASSTSPIPKNPAEATMALLGWAKKTGKYQDWFNKCTHFFSVLNPGLSKDQINEMAVTRIKEWAEWNAAECPPETPPLEAVYWIVWDGRYTGADDLLPEWIGRYRLASWAGKDLGPNHPLLKDKAKWDTLIWPLRSGNVDPELKQEFLEIVKNTIDPKYRDAALKSIQDAWNVKPYSGGSEFEGDYIKDQESEMYQKPEEPEVEEPQNVASDETDQWRTQSVEFECRLRRLVR